MAEGYLVAAAMRNEGAFLVEWVTWYRMLGFDLLVVTNDCTDHSPALLNLLHDAGWLTHTTHSPDPGTPPKRSAHRTIRAHPATARTEWLMICDVDEFLVLHDGDGTIAGFVGDTAPGRFRGIAFHWKVFGSGGETRWHDALQHRTFTRCADTHDRANASFKTLIRHPLDFDRFGAHSPMGFAGDWGTGENVLVDSEGRTLGRYHPNGAAQRATHPDRVTHRAAQMNHYMIRSPESFALKRGIPSPSAGRDRYTDDFLARYDRNETEDQSALRHADRFDALHAEAMTLPGLARLHHLCCADYVTRLAEAAGQDPRSDPRYTRHMDRATTMT
ncbi:glycosyltransferase family 2 protein [Psychromarinibacter sp. C21-152]|uniref:Glycosyltransferase family 2 protein n=1 Tax=Psychromarinibacter sediminicola TaxID=3033385 RepID=A0AAE3NXX7_9RHOB|nr:glycosyltransferase family 2 protein [Psychromarinibacter sediminicola]MDF0602985.1 glycosyltransferase family 2 protein [Psychromarinibacter sediminicola]